MTRPRVLGQPVSLGLSGTRWSPGGHVGGADERESADEPPGHLLGPHRPRAARAAGWPPSVAAATATGRTPGREDSRVWGLQGVGREPSTRPPAHRRRSLQRHGSEQLCHGIQQKIQSCNSKTHKSFPFMPQMQNNNNSNDSV